MFHLSTYNDISKRMCVEGCTQEFGTLFIASTTKTNEVLLRCKIAGYIVSGFIDKSEFL